LRMMSPGRGEGGVAVLMGVPDAGKTILCVPVVANVGTERCQALLGQGYQLRLVSREYQPFVEPSHGCLTRSDADALQEILSGAARSSRPRNG
jgi:hypothetical protein